MSNEEVFALARDAAFHTTVMEAELLRFADLVAAHEREKCAQIAAQWDIDHPNTNFGGCIANLIRGRGT
jgi:hypothetical protein